ncbi:Trypsin and/or CUB domain containing protein [Asbolus verrucosus]|uniref:Trypsin and/or CUB domain containing protein n=1 Tax=Asbolus verrucosus TaxID=1661398 RepID=A0A482VBZ7_ASBVE|nr:Trypsin and/or CUB domain containing protein [Asbolus verrucosus]
MVMSIASIFNFFMPISLAIDSNCDFYQELVMGEEYYIYNQEYPNYYTPSTACRWVGKSPEDTNIVLSCENIDLPSSTNCQGDHLSISLTGDESFTNATNYCGQTALTVITEGNSLAVGLFATSDSPGGRYVCALTAIQVTPHTTSTEKPHVCDCGWRLSPRIIGGHETGVNEFPLMGGLIDASTTELFCGASIISERYALTAAHCLLHQEPTNVGLLVGDHNLTTGTDTAAAALYRVVEFKPHPFYDSSVQQNDIAVVKTQLPIKFSVYVGPVCLPFRYTLADFYSATVIALGWGFLDFSGPKSDTLQEVDLSVVSNTECAASIPDPISANQICTYASMRDACLSDSGGPLLWQDPHTRKLQLVGIISYGIGCATKKPGVNTRVTSYLSWIASVTSDAVYCIK